VCPWESPTDSIFPGNGLVLPYTEASQSGVLAIAATFALPVVASRVGELGETVGELESGVVVPPGNAEAIARAVISLAGDPERRRQLGRNALRHAEELRREHAIGKGCGRHLPSSRVISGAASAICIDVARSGVLAHHKGHTVLGSSGGAAWWRSLEDGRQ
jgi:Glycosyl transferases group 1